MTGQTIYPKADTHSQWYYGGAFASQGITMPMDKGVKWLQHTTETAGGWPTYSGGAICPTLTFEPWLHQWRQHMPINHSARALKGGGTAYTNRANVVQTEISCYCDQALAAQQHRMDRYVGNIDQQAIDMLGDFGAWMHQEWGMQVAFYPQAIPWPAYNGQQTVKRLTVAEYNAFSGILGHMAAPAETHLDPSSLDNVAIKTRIDSVLGQVQQVKHPDNYEGYSRLGQLHAQMWALREWMAAKAKEHPGMPQFAQTGDDLETAALALAKDHPPYAAWAKANGGW